MNYFMARKSKTEMTETEMARCYTAPLTWKTAKGYLPEKESMNHPLTPVVTRISRGLLAYARTGVDHDALTEKVNASARGLGVNSAWIWWTINELADRMKHLWIITLGEETYLTPYSFRR